MVAAIWARIRPDQAHCGETDVAKIRKYCRGRVPARLRHQVRVETAVHGNSVTNFECRPPWHPNLTEWSKSSRLPVAQLTVARQASGMEELAAAADD